MKTRRLVLPTVVFLLSGVAIAGPDPKAPNAQQGGTSSSLVYMASDNTARRAELTHTDVHSIGTPWENTDDPDWIVHNPDGSVPHVKNIMIRATDGTVRAVETTCSHKAPGAAEHADKIFCQFRYYYTPEYMPLPNYRDEHVSSSIALIDPNNGKHIGVYIEDVGAPFNSSPQFHVDYLQ